MAVKVFNLQQSGSSRSFEAECEALSSARHRCLVKIITCCSSINTQGQEFKALVFEFMPNGSLDDWLHPKSENCMSSNMLSLAQRLDIAVDIMDAIDYLHNHCDPQIIHCDLKPSNILLAEDMSARVGDFGISKVLSENTIGIRGSIGYVAPGKRNCFLLVCSMLKIELHDHSYCIFCRVRGRLRGLSYW
jgi:serine/threonine protein kinase